MINPHWLELPLSRTNFHGPKGVRAIEVLLYLYRMVYDFDFDIVNFPLLDGDVPRSISSIYGVYISQLICFVHVSSHADDFNTRNKLLTASFSNKDIDIIMRFKTFIGSISYLNIISSARPFGT